MHLLRRNSGCAARIEQLTQNLLGLRPLRTHDAEMIAPAADLDVKALLEEPQVLIEWTAKICQPQIVPWTKLELTLDERGWRGSHVRRSPRAVARRSAAPCRKAPTIARATCARVPRLS